MIDRKTLSITLLICGALLLLIGLQMAQMERNSLKLPVIFETSYVSGSFTPLAVFPIFTGDLTEIGGG